MKVTKNMTMEEYDVFCKKKCPKKIPDWKSKDYRRRVGDCIYDFSKGHPPKIREGIHNESNRDTDLSGDNALLSKHFYYLGDEPVELPPRLYGIITNGPGHKSKSNDPYVDDFISWIEGKDYSLNELQGEPQLKGKCIFCPMKG